MAATATAIDQATARPIGLPEAPQHRITEDELAAVLTCIHYDLRSDNFTSFLRAMERGHVPHKAEPAHGGMNRVLLLGTGWDVLFTKAGALFCARKVGA